MWLRELLYYVGVIYTDNGKENGNYYLGIGFRAYIQVRFSGLGFRVWGYDPNSKDMQLGVGFYGD